MSHMDIDAAVRLVERRQEQRRRSVEAITNRATIAEIAVDGYRTELKRRIRSAAVTALSFTGVCGIITGLWLLTEWVLEKIA